MAKIKNINGTSDYSCKCGTWLKHWSNFSKQPTPQYCVEKTCRNTDLLGAHVQKANSSDSNWYIVPLCNSHNKSSGELDISDSCTFVSANRKETCEKS
jgi:hypothetical protein